VKEEGIAGWRTLHNEELHNLYFSQNIIRVIKSGGIGMGRTCSMHGKMRNGSKFLVREPEGRKPLLKHSHSFEGYLKVENEEIGCGSEGRVQVAQ
jgi:hypothetical protein